MRYAENQPGQAERLSSNHPKAAAAVGAPTADEKPLGEQRNLMWAFPSFSCLLQDPDTQPPAGMELWKKWGLFLNSWAGLAWYLNYKYKIEEELKAYEGALSCLVN